MTERRQRAAVHEVPEWVETWQGRQDQLDAFLAGKPLGGSYDGTGFIVNRDPDDRVPKASCEITIAYPPDFNFVDATPSRSMKVAKKSATVNGENLIPTSLLPPGTEQPSTVVAEQTISFYAPEMRYRYFSETMPDGPRFTTILTRREPTVLSSVIVAKFNGAEVSFTGAVAPAAIVTALTFPLVAKVVSDGGAPIKGTPWYECEDVVTLEFQGD